jgi:serine/threonine protein kinase
LLILFVTGFRMKDREHEKTRRAMSADSQRIEAVFAGALALPDVHERIAYLDQSCAGDADLRREVESLLAAHEEADVFLEEPADGARLSPAAAVGQVQGAAGEDTRAPSEQPGERIGRYKLLQKIGEGGMGVVWMAEQEEPVRRRVALKVIKLGMDTRQVLARFEAERQALALMEHPNIARVFDGGATGTGRPYFVMELVRGLSITKYCHEAKMSTRQRLELFAQVCRAVQHAHQKGIIHRDLKPSNILVTVQDDRPVAKVIDFGVAKATEGRLTDKTLFTGFQQLIGTPAYMSPEQASLGSLDIDTRSDTYSLGVVLYELLTGRPPFDTKELLKQGYEAVLRTIREVDPPTPSSRLKQERAIRLGANAKSEIRNPKSEIDHDLDWIVMKCLEKDRARRYDTANGLAADIERYLHDEPVLARPPSALYRWRKFTRKHFIAVTGTIAFVALLLAATAVSAWLALWANRERAQAISARSEAAANERQARKAEAEAKDILRFFEAKVLAATRPEGQHGGLGRDVTIRAALEAAEPEISRAFSNQPLAEASIRETLGMTFHHLGDSALAARQHERAMTLRQSELGTADPSVLESMNRLAMAYIALGQLHDAEGLLNQALGVARSAANPDRYDVNNFMDNLATVYARTGRHSNAVALLERALETVKARRGDASHSTLRILNNLANTYRKVGRGADALTLMEETWQRTRDKLGENHPDTLSTMNNLSVMYRAGGQLERAASLSEQAVKTGEDVLGPDHPSTMNWRRNLALAYRDMRRMDDALPLFEKTVALFKARSDPDPSDLVRSQKELAQFYGELDRLSDAQAVWQELLEEQRRKLPADDFAVAETMSGLGESHLRQKNYEKAEPLLVGAYDAFASAATNTSPSTQSLQKRTAERIVLLYEGWGKSEQAAQWREKLK